MAVLVIIVWAGVVVALFVGLLTAPRWCFRSLARHRLWALRDRLVDDVLADRLPGDNNQVADLRRQLEVAILHVTKMRLIDVFVFGLLHDRRPSVSGHDGSGHSSKLTDHEEERLRKHQDRFHFLLLSSLLLGSWVGLALAGAYLVSRLGPAGGKRRSWRQAVERASRTRFGRRTARGAFLASSCYSPA